MTPDEGFFADSKSEMALDQYGFPGMAVANRILLATDDYGESLEDLEERWESWSHHIPFDAPVAAALGNIYERRLGHLDPQDDAAAYERLERKLLLARSRASRYELASF